MSDTVIKIDHVYKEYRLGAIGGTTLREDLLRFGAKLRGKEDPTLRIGQKGYTGERFLALDDLSFEVPRGEALGIIGRNGAGKSTLLKLLSRVTAPTAGTIMYKGRVAAMLEVGTGFHPELTGRENVYMNGAILGMRKAEIAQKFDQIVEFAELERFIDTPVKRYSSGMYVKLAFAVAAHLDAEIMVMDEVLAVGDMKFQQKCLGRMGDAANTEGRTVLYVSHNMNTIRQLCSRCIVLDHGKVIFDGDTERAISMYMEQRDAVELANASRRFVYPSHMEHLEIDNGMTDSEGLLRLSLRWTTKERVEGAYLCMILTDSNGVKLGVTHGSLPSVAAGETRTDRFIFDASSLAQGRYYFSLEIQRPDASGNFRDFDCVLEAGSFLVVDMPKGWPLNRWQRQFAGSIFLPPMQQIERDS
ncbi:MAG: ABC transporter ATP-binding protein [Clostridiales bacterium]|nr:ABC transporter ATP-binding protein [Clostridiales bacterium]